MKLQVKYHHLNEQLIYLFQDKCHRMRPSMFEDSEWRVLLQFPCITGFILDSMHMIDGGLLIDFIETMYRFGFDSPTIAEKLEQRIVWMNKFTFLEQARSLR